MLVAGLREHLKDGRLGTHRPRAVLRPFERLTSEEQAAVLHGLRQDAFAWNAFVEKLTSQELEVADQKVGRSGAVAEVSASKGSVVDSIIGAAWRLTKRYGPALGALLADAAPAPGRAGSARAGAGGVPVKGGGAAVAVGVVGQLLELLPWALDLREGPVKVDGLETVLYLDDSASMSGQNLSEAKAALRKMAHLLQERVEVITACPCRGFDSPTRVCTFADHKQVIVPREEPRSRRSAENGARSLVVVEEGEQGKYFSPKFDSLNPEILCLQWKGKSAGTYMWHMILTDLRDKYIPGNGKLRVIVITDGLDVSSPHPYHGIQGMDPMMKELLKDGYDLWDGFGNDIEWHIVVVDIPRGPFMGPMIQRSDTAKYEALAEVTGGGFLHIDEPGVMDEFNARHFLSSLEKVMTGADASILENDDFKKQQGKSAEFLRRLHASNRHVDDQDQDLRRRQQQLEDYTRGSRDARGSSRSELPYVTDLEGNLEHWERFIELSQVLHRAPDGSIILQENAHFVFGGDAVDHYPGDLQILDDLLDLKRRYGERVQFIVGNRDVNKLRLPFELSEAFIENWPLKEHPGVYWLPTKRPRDVLSEEILETNAPTEHLKWTGFFGTLGAGNAFESRRAELKRKDGCLGTDEEVLQSFVKEASPGGRLFEYLTLAKLAVQIGDALFVHGGLPRADLTWTPGWLPPAGERRPVREWLKGLDRFKTEQLAQVLSATELPKAAHSMEGGYAHPQPAAGLMQPLVSNRRRPRVLLRVCRPKIKPLKTRSAGDDYQPLKLDAAMLQWLRAGGIRRICSGHLPHGDSPLEVTAITADLSYAKQVEWPGEMVKEQAVAEVVLEQEDTFLHGLLSTGARYEARLSDAAIGMVDPEGWRVKGRVHGQLLLSRNQGWDFEGRLTADADMERAFGSDFYEQGFRDFEPFHELSSWDAQRVRNNCRVQGEACFVVQIKDGKMYVAEEQAGFQSRNHLTMAMLLRVSAKFFPLPDAEFVVDTSDGFSRIEAPLFVIAKFPSSRGGILYPDFSSYAWPESECPSEPFGSHVWSEEWCQHRFLANLPGNTMALALKYRLLCGSVVMTSPLMYHEWYYSQLKDGEHYVALDLSWSSAADALAQLRSERVKLAEGIGARAREWARTHLTDDAFDCYWLHLIRMASQHFPPPQLTPSSRPVEALLAASAAGASAAATAQERRSSLDVIIVIPARAGDEALMDHARNTWLGEVQDSKLSTRHFFVISLRDPDVDGLRRAEDLLVVDCEHGYRQLMQKMAVAYRILLDRFVVRFFIRADVDSVLPLQCLLPLLPHASAGQSLVRVPDVSGCGGSPGHAARWKMPAVGRLQCQIECAMDRGCHFFQVSESGDCATFSHCDPLPSPIVTGGEVYHYRLRTLVGAEALDEANTRQRHPFILGTILRGNEVLVNDSYNPQWNNIRYSHDLGLSVYPPYPEASGYAMSADLAAFLAGVGVGELSTLSWKAWAIEDSALGTILAGLRFDLLQMPTEVRERVRVIRVEKE
eukprot:g134.t1